MAHTPPPHYPPPPPPRPNRTNAIIIWTAVVLIAAIVGAGLYVSQSDDDGGGGIVDPVACKQALAENLRKASAAGPDAPTAPAPPACVGLDEATLERITGEVISEYWEGPEAEKLFGDAWRDAVESAYPSP